MIRKRINPKRLEDVLSRLDEMSELTISIQEFVSTNFERLEKSRKSVKELHDFLLVNEIDLRVPSSQTEDSK